MTKSVTMTTAIQVVPELWASNIMPEGILESWLRPDGSLVEIGDPVAAVRVEDCLHQLCAPARGRLRTELKTDSVVEPGMVIGSVLRTVAPA